MMDIIKLFECLSNNRKTCLTCIIRPIDGTMGYKHHNGYFCNVYQTVSTPLK